MEEDNIVSSKDLVIIITTSPIQSNPSTQVIDRAIASIKMQPSLKDIEIYIICDGVKNSPENISKFKSGVVSSESLAKYEEYKNNLKVKYSK